MEICLKFADKEKSLNVKKFGLKFALLLLLAVSLLPCASADTPKISIQPWRPTDVAVPTPSAVPPTVKITPPKPSAEPAEPALPTILSPVVSLPSPPALQEPVPHVTLSSFERKAPAIIVPRPPIPTRILGRGLVSSGGLRAFILANKPKVSPAYAEEVASAYTEEADAEGVNSDVAFSQMCLETGFLGFGGSVTPDMNNFCGLGTTDKETKGASFASIELGVRAHIQHLKAYATNEPLNGSLVDPRYHYVKYGSSPTIDGLAGSWAMDTAYAVKLRAMLNRLYKFYFEKFLNFP
jgi:hypothetical protein